MPRGIPSKEFTAEIVTPEKLPSLQFSRQFSRMGYWDQRLDALLASNGGAVKIREEDSSSLLQLRQKAKRRSIQLLVARRDGFVYVKAFIPSEDQLRLFLWLREPRTVEALKAKGLELDIVAELTRLEDAGHAIRKDGKWRLTPAGMAAIGGETK